MKGRYTNCGTAGVLVFLACVIAASCGPSKDKMRERFTESCSTNLLPAFTDTVTREAAIRYCECSGNAVVTRLSDKQLRVVMRLQEDGNDSAAIALLQPVLQPCHDSLMLAIETASPIAPPAP